MARCKYPDSVCANMTLLNGVAYCDSVPCSLRDELPKPTNADRIRAMSDEELAQFIPNWSYAGACKYDGVLYCNHECGDCVRDWLQQPAPEEAKQNV